MRNSSTRWTIAGRVSKWFVGTTAALVLTVSFISDAIVRHAIERELAAFAEEELGEMEAFFSVSAKTLTEFEELAQEFADHHEEAPMAWRAWYTSTGEIWGECGELELLSGLDPDKQAQGLQNYGDSLRWETKELTPELTMGLLFDASHRLQTARFFRMSVFGFAGLSIIAALLAGVFLGRRFSRLMKRVANEARSVKHLENGVEFDFDFDRAPDEIREVGVALQEMLQNIRLEIEKASLIASGLAHELRSPIQNMMGEADVALLRQRTPEDYQLVLESQRDELRELGRVVDNLVLLVASESIKRAPEWESFDLATELDQRLGRERNLADKKQVQIDLDIHEPMAIRGDREALLLCLRNLIANAIDWSPDGEHVLVTMLQVTEGLRVLVEDSGPGIAPGERQRIFQPFYRSQTGPAHKGDRIGYGLGLAIARAAVEAHGGHIDVDESPLGGARFAVDLPPSPRESSPTSGVGHGEGRIWSGRLALGMTS